MSNLKELLAKRQSGEAKSTIQLNQSGNVKIVSVESEVSKKGNGMIVVTVEEELGLKLQKKEFMRTSQVKYLEGFRKKMNLLLEFFKIPAPTNQTPFEFVLDANKEPITINEELTGEALSAELKRTKEEHGSDEFINVTDDSGKKFRVLVVVDESGIPAYNEAYANALKQCIGKSFYLELKEKDSQGYWKTFYLPRKSAK
jgi:hypothetical protein